MRILVTGGCGFIGSNFVRHLKQYHPDDQVTVLDALTYAGNLANLDGLGAKVISFDIADEQFVRELFDEQYFDAVVHLAAETHVDRSIHSASIFARTNVLGTQNLLEAARRARVQRFVQVSSDEVFGDLGSGLYRERPPAVEDDPLHPSSPYAASKAAADLLALAYHRTHRFPVIVTRCTNNYGQFQHPEKLIPTAVLRALKSEEIPIYGDGRNVRDWLHVDDHCRALDLVLRHGRDGEIYNIGSGEGRENIEVVREIIRLVGKGQMVPVADRPGHDRRYAVDSTKIRKNLGWEPLVKFADGLERIVAWYRKNEAWWGPVLSGEYREWSKKNYGEPKAHRRERAT